MRLPEDWCGAVPGSRRSTSAGGHARLTADHRAVAPRRREVRPRQSSTPPACTEAGGPRQPRKALRSRGFVSTGSVARQSAAAEHLFLGLELEARGVRLTGPWSCAWKMPWPNGDEPALKFEAMLREHVGRGVVLRSVQALLPGRDACACDCSIRLIGRCCGDRAPRTRRSARKSIWKILRLAWRLEPALFWQIVRIPRTPRRGLNLPPGTTPTISEAQLLDRACRALGVLEATCGAAAPQSGRVEEGRAQGSKPHSSNSLGRHADIYQELLFSRMLRPVDSRLSTLAEP